MPVWVIDTLKPKNGLDFPVVEAVDVAVEGYSSLADAVSHFATDVMIEDINAVLDLKADKTTTDSLQAQINQIEISASAEAVVAPEVAAARVGADGTSYQTLKVRLDAENAKSFQFRGELHDLNYTTIAEASEIGCYNSRNLTTAELSDKPADVTGAFSLIVNNWQQSNGKIEPVQLLITSTGDVWQRFITSTGETVVDWASSSTTLSQHSAELSVLGAKVSEITDEIFWTNIELGLQNNKFWDVSGETASLENHENFSASHIVNVSEGETFTIYACQGDSHKVRIWTMCDDNMNIIAKAEDFYDYEMHKESFTIPNGVSKIVISHCFYRAPSNPFLKKEVSQIEKIYGEIDDINHEISDIESDIIESKAKVNQRISISNTKQYWNFETGTAVLTPYDAYWHTVEPIPVHEGEIYQVIGSQGGSHKVRIWIVTDDDLNVIATADDYYENSEITQHTLNIKIPSGGTKLLLTTTTETAQPYIILYKIVSKVLEGIRISLLGDSISAYTGTIPQGNEAYYTGRNAGVTSASQMWWNVLCDETGMIPCVINGWSGSGITQLTDSAHLNKVPMSDTSRCQALHTNDAYPDVILIAGGVNDFSYARQASQKPSGWDGKETPINGNSFDETYAVMIKNIQTAYPNAVVVCLSTWFTMRGTDNGYTLLNGEGLTQADYDEAIERVAKYMRVPYINVERCGFSRSNFYPTYAEDSSSIPTHPNARGQRVMGEYLADILPQLVHSFASNAPEPED